MMETPGASGSGVVEEVVSNVQSLFGSDNKFLRLPMLNLRMGLIRIPIAVAMMEAYGRWIGSDSSLPKIRKVTQVLKQSMKKLSKPLILIGGRCNGMT